MWRESRPSHERPPGCGLGTHLGLLLVLPALLTVACSKPPQDSTERGTAASSASSPPAPAPSDLFVEGAGAVGLDFVHWNGMSGEFYFPEMTGGGGALVDYDNDGDLDVYLVQGTLLGTGKSLDDAIVPPPNPLPLTDRLYRNDLLPAAGGGPGALRFTDVTETSGLTASDYGMGVASGDFDNDGWVDLYVTNLGPNRLLRNNGDGTFRDVTRESGTDDPRWSVAALFFDYDRDGWLDLYVGNYVDFTLATHKVCPNESGAPDYCGPLAYEPQPDRLLRNRGDGTFEDTSFRAGPGTVAGATLGVVAADFDGDGWLDLYVAHDQMPNALWRNQQDGTFRDQALLGGCAVNREGQPEASMGVDAGDFDNDGDEDLFMAHLTRETNTLYLNRGAGFFDDVSRETGVGAPSWSFTGFGTAWFDYDRDGWLDLLVANGAVKTQEAQVRAGDPYPLRQPNQLFRNLGDGRLEEVTARAGAAFSASEVSRGSTFGDVDNDGDPDVLIVNNNGPVHLLINQAAAGRHWLGLRLLDRDGRRDMLGAWVAVVRPGRETLWRRVRTGGSYASANDPRLLLGLGDAAAAVHGVRVQWPDGGVEEWDEVPVDTYTTLRQGPGRQAP